MKFFVVLFLTLLALPGLTDNSANCDKKPDEITSVAFQTSCALMREKAAQTSWADTVYGVVKNCAVESVFGAGKGLVATVSDLGSLIKLAAVEAPAYLWTKAKNAVLSLWTKAPDAVTGASESAKESLEQQRSILDKARALYEVAQEFSAQVSKAFQTGAAQFMCLPPAERAAALCHALSATFTEIIAGGVIVKGVARTASITASVAKFLAKTNNVQAYAGMNAAQKLEAASAMMVQVEKREREISRLNGASLVEYSNVKGEKYLKLEEYATTASGERSLISAREIMLDSKTKAIDANTEQGRALLESLVNGKDGSKYSAVFIDVNNLGKTNYFANGTKSGDDYLRGVGTAIQDSIRPDDLVFKLGGDEILVLAKTKNPAEVQTISQRIVDAVDSSPTARDVFRSEQILQAENYKNVQRASSLEDVSPSITGKLSAAEKEKAQTNFSQFQQDYLEKQKDRVIEQAKYRPSISVGSAVVGKNSLEAVLAKVESQATEVKIRYKEDIGLDAQKYGGDAAKNGKANLRAKPIVLPTDY